MGGNVVHGASYVGSALEQTAMSMISRLADMLQGNFKAEKYSNVAKWYGLHTIAENGIMVNEYLISLN